MERVEGDGVSASMWLHGSTAPLYATWETACTKRAGKPLPPVLCLRRTRGAWQGRVPPYQRNPRFVQALAPFCRLSHVCFPCRVTFLSSRFDAPELPATNNWAVFRAPRLVCGRCARARGIQRTQFATLAKRIDARNAGCLARCAARVACVLGSTNVQCFLGQTHFYKLFSVESMTWSLIRSSHSDDYCRLHI